MSKLDKSTRWGDADTGEKLYQWWHRRGTNYREHETVDRRPGEADD